MDALYCPVPLPDSTPLLRCGEPSRAGLSGIAKVELGGTLPRVSRLEGMSVDLLEGWAGVQGYKNKFVPGARFPSYATAFWSEVCCSISSVCYLLPDTLPALMCGRLGVGTEDASLLMGSALDVAPGKGSLTRGP